MDKLIDMRNPVNGMKGKVLGGKKAKQNNYKSQKNGKFILYHVP